MTERRFEPPPGAFHAVIHPPGDKSLAHRALILAAMAHGLSTIRNLPTGADVASTREATSRLGSSSAGETVRSPGIRAWSEPGASLDCGNSGTTMRLLAGAAAASSVSVTLVGDSSLMRRPMSRLVVPLRRLGAEIALAEDGTAPIRISGGSLHGADVVLPIASAQVRSAVALAALHAEGETTIDSPPGFRDHTERWLAHLGLGRFETATRFRVLPGEVPVLDLSLPSDPSSAAFLWAAAAVRIGAEVVTPDVSLNPGRTGFLDVLGAMGAGVTVTRTGAVMGDPVGTVAVTGRPLRGIEVRGELAVRALDELPLVAVVAAAATGPTLVDDAHELRVKESDRIASSVALAEVAGATAVETPDGFTVTPAPAPKRDHIDAAGDHRVAMAGAVAALVRGSSVTVAGFEAADVSWPGFGEILEEAWS